MSQFGGQCCKGQEVSQGAAYVPGGLKLRRPEVHLSLSLLRNALSPPLQLALALLAPLNNLL
jgi:hypothetical protein